MLPLVKADGSLAILTSENSFEENDELLVELPVELPIVPEEVPTVTESQNKRTRKAGPSLSELICSQHNTSVLLHSPSYSNRTVHKHWLNKDTL